MKSDNKLTDEQIESIHAECTRLNGSYVFDHLTFDGADLAGLIDRMRVAEKDSERYHFIANSCEVIYDAKEVEDEAELDGYMESTK